MKRKSNFKNKLSYRDLYRFQLEGAFITLSIVPFLAYSWIFGLNRLFNHPVAFGILLSSSICIFVGGFLAPRNIIYAKYTAYMGIILSAIFFVPSLVDSQLKVLSSVVVFSFLIYFVNEYSTGKNTNLLSRVFTRYLYRAKSSCIISIMISLVSLFFYINKDSNLYWLPTIVAFVSGYFGLRWSLLHRYSLRAKINICVFTLILIMVVIGAIYNPDALWISIIWPIQNLFLLPNDTQLKTFDFTWFEPLVDHPARLLIFTFLSLIIVGTILLVLPISSTGKHVISLINAAFTSVSAVCVTGLIVLDTPVDFSFFGQFIIMLLIQTGGLGIMTIAVIVLHALGRRLSVKQERIMAALSGDERFNLYRSLRRIVFFTISAEFIGAFILSILFYLTGQGFLQALWKGIFTSVSAFCNAGFALESENLVCYQSYPLILHTVGILIILGGLSPAVCVFIPKFLSFRKVPVQALIVLVTTIFLLVAGFIAITAVEWNSALKGLSVWDKINNAWFQSVTLRTAGFNSVDLALITPSAYIVMALLMFVGGSPGGTAGGIKTTTLAIFIFCIYSTIKNRPEIVVKKRRIEAETVYKAIAVTCTSMLILFTSIFVLDLTQFIPIKEIIFEVFSALGTVGLSIGATTELDGLGKIVIMITMFLGRIGPLTLFMILSIPYIINKVDHSEIKLTIT